MQQISTALNFCGRIRLVLLWTAFAIHGGGLHAAQSGFEVNEIADGVYLRPGLHQPLRIDTSGAIANIGFIVGRDSVAVIDPGGSPAAGAALRDYIRAQIGLPVSHLILTHFHPDHVFGSSAFDATAEVVAHRNYARAAAQRSEFYRLRFGALFAPSDAPLTRVPTLEVSDELRIDLGGRILRVRAHKTAHTDNDLSVFDNASGVLWASDLVFDQRIPSLDGNLRGWLDVMGELAAYDSKLVVPGHGQPRPWAKIAAPQQRYLKRMLDQTRRFIARGGKLSDAIETIAVDEAEHWQLFDEHHRGNVVKAYTELEWE